MGLDGLLPCTLLERYEKYEKDRQTIEYLPEI
jgi:hypothetical protein